MKKIIYYPIFIQCLVFITDPFWKYVYEDLACGICPYGLYLQKNYLCCNFKNKEFSYKIDQDKKIEEIYDETYKLLKIRVGLLSEKEKLSQRDKVIKSNKANLYKKREEWSDVKKKIIRDTLLESFIMQKTNHYNLSISVSQKILSMLVIGLLFKSINSKDIFFVDGNIKEINGFHFEPKKVVITKNIYHNKNTKAASNGEIINNKVLNTYWVMYLNEIKNIIKKKK
jgi:hypothetical protein